MHGTYRAQDQAWGASARGAVAADEAPLYLAAAAALASAAFAAAAGGGSLRVGLLAASASLAGVGLSWAARLRPLHRALALCLPTAFVAAIALQALVSWEIRVEATDLYRAQGDVGLLLALRLMVLLVFASFLLIRREFAALALVPGLSIFGLVGAQGYGDIVSGSFCVFLPAGLVALAQAMMLSETASARQQAEPGWRGAGWRQRHWAVLAATIAGIMLIGYLIFVPVATYATQYRWYMALPLTGGGYGRLPLRTPSESTPRSYSVGRGPAVPTDRPAFSFTGPPVEFWRGEVFDIYTGNAWRSSDDSPRSLALGDGSLELSGTVGTEPSVAVTTHQVRIEDRLPFVFYAPGRVHHLRFRPELAGYLPNGLRVDKFGVVFGPGGVLPEGTRYEVTSVRLERGRSPGQFELPSALPPDFGETYLTLPISARRVADLAREVTREMTDPTDKLAALVQYLHSNCAYSLDAPAVPFGEDAAEYFVLRQKRGYCDLFATALAVMGRAVGVPTRLVVGYAGGEYDEERDRYVVRESDAHAWVEAYLPPSGWVSVDPAPAGDAPPLSPMQRTALAARFFYQDHPYVASGLAAAVFLSLGLALVLLWRARRGPPIFRGNPNSRTVVLRVYSRLCHVLGRRGLPRRPPQTPFEFLETLESAAAAAPARGRPHIPEESLGPIRSLTNLFILARYAGGPVDEDTARLAVRRLEEAQLTLRGKSAPAQPG